MTHEDVLRYNTAKGKVLEALGSKSHRYDKLQLIADAVDVQLIPDALSELIWEVYLAGKQAGKVELKNEVANL